MGLTEKEIEDLILTKLVEDFVNTPKDDDGEDDDSYTLEELYNEDDLNDIYASGNVEKYDETEEDEERATIGDVLNEMFANGSVDRDSYVKSIMELTKIGYVNSDLKNEEDVKDSKLNGFEINGLTDKGRKYVDKILADEKMRNDLKQSLAKCDKLLKDIANSGIVQLGAAVASMIK